MSAEEEEAISSGRQKLLMLRSRFAAGLRARMEEIQTHWRAVLESRSVDAFEALSLRVHRLSGAGATFGYPAVSLAAQEVESKLKRFVPGESASAEASDDLATALEELLETCERAIGDQVPDSGEFSLLFPTADRDPRKLLLVEDDAALAEVISVRLAAHGFRVTSAASPATLGEMVERISPAAILMDLIFAEGDLAGAEAVARLQAQSQESPPVVFFSSRGDLEGRLAAVRAGGAAYFTKPLDIPLLVAKLEVLTGRRPRSAYRILVVDDDEELAVYYARTLESAGMQASVCTDPLLAMDRLSGSKPDLVLLDFHMPGCSGPELARALRQAEGFESLPILFLSTETDRLLQLQAMISGGDEFLTKPIEAEHLVLAVASRAARGRQLKGLVEHDGLTRVLNRVSLMHGVEVELARARRMRNPVSYAMIDLDEFKRVNDDLGHTAGDRVLRALANLLMDRLRVTDVVGRYGGEEFGIVFPMTTAEAAARVMEPIRRQFEMLDLFQGRRLTFSCGIASHPEHPDARRLVEAADRALYAAKHAGRNRIELAPPPPR